MIISRFGGKCCLSGEELYQGEVPCPGYLLAAVVVAVTPHGVLAIFVWGCLSVTMSLLDYCSSLTELTRFKEDMNSVA